MEEYKLLNKFNIIIVDNNKTLLNEIKSILNVYVNKIYTVEDAGNCLLLYHDLKKNNIKIDAIITNVDLQRTDGISLLKKIREENKNIPFFLISSSINENQLIDAIKLNVSAYFKKPINFGELLDKLNSSILQYHQQELIVKQKKELELYLDAIDNVAIISKTDLKGNITFANDFFVELSKYTKDELIGKPHNIIRHKDTPKDVFKDLWITIRKGETWQGKIKNYAKDGSIYYVNSTIIPIFDDLGEEVVEYLGIRFLTTEDEVSKREFRKKVIQNIQESKKKENFYLQKIKNLELGINDSSSLSKQIDDLSEKNEKLLSQIIQNEEEIKNLNAKNSSLSTNANQKVKKTLKFALEEKEKNGKLKNEQEIFVEEIKVKKKIICTLEDSISEKDKRISDLEDVLEFG